MTPADADTLVAIAKLEARFESFDERLDEALRLMRSNAEKEAERTERWIRAETKLESELTRTTESGERCLKLLEALEERVRSLEAQRDKDAGRADAGDGAAKPSSLVAAHAEESRARSGLWRVLATVFGAVGGAFTTWLATKK